VGANPDNTDPGAVLTATTPVTRHGGERNSPQIEHSFSCYDAPGKRKSRYTRDHYGVGFDRLQYAHIVRTDERLKAMKLLIRTDINNGSKISYRFAL
jgi:hypothetical protein